MLRVGIIGAGMMGRTHAECWSRLEDVKIQVVCDVQVERAEVLSRTYNCDVSTSADDVIKRSDIDIVDICTPTPFHSEIAVSALEKGKHTLCEKPVARNLESARKVVKTAREVDVKFMTAHVVRFFPEYVTARNLIDQGAIGIPRMARTKRGGQYPLGRWNDWFSDVDMSGGCLVDTGIHDFDYLRWIFGDVERVYASALTWRRLEHKDYGLVTLRFKSKAMAQVEIIWAQPPGTPFNTGFELIGTDGLIAYNSQDSSSLRIMVSNGDNIVQRAESPLAESPYLTEIRHFVSCIEENKEPSVTPEDAYKALEVAIASLESARINRPVSVGGDI
ncbi:MAG TPA: Gfo/Idh/MocA family oxidoreductase [bacterium]|nr:Gfo/Idh/MocA family oxidoreductase [bacterium]